MGFECRRLKGGQGGRSGRLVEIVVEPFLVVAVRAAAGATSFIYPEGGVLEIVRYLD